MSALHSHPDITMVGELRMVEKFPLPESTGELRGCICPVYNLPTPQGITQNTPVIFLLRDLEEIDLSSYHQHLSPAEQLREPHRESRLSHWKREREILDDFIHTRKPGLGSKSRNMIVSYNELCGGEDVRELRLGAELCAFLRVSEQPLRPLTYKPTMIQNESLAP